MVTMFIDTLPSPYYDRIVRNMASTFADLVVVGERIELGIRRGKFAQTNNSTSFAKKPTLEKKKGEANAVLIEPIFPQTKANTASYSTRIQGGSRQCHTSNRANSEQTQTTTNARPIQQGARRSHRVLASIPMTYTQLFPLLLEQKQIEVVPLKPLEPPYLRSYDPNARCDYHGEAIGHATKRCWSLKHKVQDLLDTRLLRFEDKGPNIHSNPFPAHGAVTVNTISHMDERVAGANKRKDGESGQAMDSTNQVEEGSHLYQVSFIIQVSARLVYNNNAVPCWYPMEEPQAPRIIKETATLEITNIAGAMGMMWSERIFASEVLRIKDPALAKKERMVIEEEAQEFLKVIRHNEYEMLDQLHKTPRRILLLLLLINSKSHRELLLKILNEAHVPQNITPAKFGGIINNNTTSRCLSFSKKEVPIEGKSHNQPLHIAVKCENYMIARVVIDNGSSHNVMPKTTLDKLYSLSAILRNSLAVIRAFDGSKREVMGEITLPIHIGPTTFDITF
ncbi:hypothetical protein CR513_58043, partial [Mucuna pruriens]